MGCGTTTFLIGEASPAAWVFVHPSHLLSSLRRSLSNGLPMQEVAKHNSRESAWIIIKDKVYDITSESARPRRLPR